MVIKNLKKAGKRIKKAIKDNENIILFSDADLDGVTSLIILEETIKNLGGKIKCRYFPDLWKHGYGLSQKALVFLKKYSPALLILTDCGIGNFDIIEQSKKIGLTTIIIDHHEVINKMPDAEIIVDPKQKGDKYAFKFLAACGVVYKLAEELLGVSLSENIKKNFLELVALGTIADKMPQIEDNKFFIEKGLDSIPFSFRPAFQAFFEKFSLKDYLLEEIIQKLVSTLQISEIKNHLMETYLFLNEKNEKKAVGLLDVLLKKSAQRWELIRLLAEQIEEKINLDNPDFIFEGGEEVPFVLTGALAGRVCNAFQKPCFIIATHGALTRGSVRTPKEVNSLSALDACSHLLEMYGGHIPASGFSLKTKNVLALKNCLTNYFS